MKTIHAPRVHLNGSGKARLVEALDKAYDALRVAYDALRETAPNGRDYYTEGDRAIYVAQDEHRNRLLAIDNVNKELELIIGAIDENQTVIEYKQKE